MMTIDNQLRIRLERAARRRRQFLLAVIAGVFAVTSALPQGAAADGARKQKRPNIIYIMTDQQQAGMMSCAGNPYVKTPAMDSLARTGVRFERAYCANPVCLPSRLSMMTARMPSWFGVKSNADSHGPISRTVLEQAMGSIFRRAGYDVGYGGKVHLPRGMTPETMGFERITRDQRAGLAEAAAAFVKKKRDRPFLLVASLINPHDICYMAINDFDKKRAHPPALTAALQRPAGVSEADFFARLCPPLPANYEVPALEPECITTELLQARPFRQHARDTWSDRQWRLHRWAYCRLTETVDAHVGKILRAVREAGLEESTVIIFSSDHGDLNAAHRMEHKTVLYEEAVRIPLIISYKGVTRAGGVDRTHLVSNGLDLIPTMCDFAGIEPPKGLPGRSLRPLAEGREPESWRDQIVVESQVGRMLRTDRYKYNVYESGAHRQQLIDLEKDPGEMVNLAEDRSHRDVLQEHRRRLRRWVETIGDKIGREYVPDRR